MSLAAARQRRAEDAIVTYKSLAPDIAFEIARVAMDRCRKDGYQVAVIVLDRFGAPLVGFRDRYAGIGAWDIATGKAWTAVNFTKDTSALVRDGTVNPALTRLEKMTVVAGGIVVEAGGSVLGGIGVAGAPGGDKDEACAKAGPRRGARQAGFLIAAYATGITLTATSVRRRLEATIGRLWPVASFRGHVKTRSLTERSGHETSSMAACSGRE